MRPIPTSGKPPLAAVPELDRIASDLRCLTTLSKPAITTLLLRASVVQSALVAALAAEETRECPAVIAQDDRLLTIEQAAERLGVTKDWLYRAAKKLPFVVRLAPGQLRFSAAGIDRHIRAKTLKPAV